MTDATEMVPRPASGRVFSRRRRVRLGDASPGGRLRLDALARYLQDVSDDDTRDAGFDDEMGWVVRRTAIAVTSFPVVGEEIQLDTFCSGTGGRWAERRVIVEGDQGGRVDAATLWVHLDVASGRPKVLPPQFFELFGEAGGGRTVRARLTHGDPTGGAVAGATTWRTRFADFDVLRHMNNAAYWEVVEEELGQQRHVRAPLRAELEFRAPVERGDDIKLAVDRTEAGFDLWLMGGVRVFATALVRAE